MSSILTNNSAMVALQTMKSINRNMNMTQAEISTGKSVSTAKDNAAIWAISKVMESDVKGFKGISDSLAVGSSTISVARQAAETVTDLLTEVKGKIVAAQADNVDRTKIQTDIVALRDQIASVVGAAQFNGLNLVDGSQTTVDVLSSLDRTSTNVSASSISITAQNLSTGSYAAKALLTGTTGASASGDTAGFSLDAATGTGTITLVEPGATPATSFVAGDKVSITFGQKTASYTVSAADAAATTTSDIVAVGLKSAIEALGISGLTVNYDSGTPGTLALSNAGTTALSASMQVSN
ncbi:MAG: flagellin, partial [Paracoccaceae bacterium]